MAAPRASERILWYENLGFLALILLFWANELLDLPRLLFGGKTRMNWREAALESLLALAVWLVVHLLTRRLLARLHYLERFLKVCAWCWKIGDGDDWLPMEQYFFTQVRYQDLARHLPGLRREDAGPGRGRGAE